MTAGGVVAEASGRGLQGSAGGPPGALPTVLVVGSLFLSNIADGFYGGIGRALPEALPFLTSACVAMSIIAWFWEYSRRERIGWVLDMGGFLFAAWVIVVPYYVLKREGKRGLGRIGLFCLTYFAAWTTGLAIRIWLRVLTST